MADHDLVARIAASTGLSESEAARVVDDVVAFYREPLDDLVRRRHRELKLRGRKNDEIFDELQRELAERPVTAPALSARQLRRIVYG